MHGVYKIQQMMGVSLNSLRLRRGRFVAQRFLSFQLAFGTMFRLMFQMQHIWRMSLRLLHLVTVLARLPIRRKQLLITWSPMCMV